MKTSDPAVADEDSGRVVPVRLALLIGLACGLVLVGVWTLFYGFNAVPYPPYEMADLAIETLPGGLATWAIETLGHWAQRSLLITGICLWVGAAALMPLALRARSTPGRGALLAMVGLPFALALAFQAGVDSYAVAIWRLIFFGGTLALAGLLAGSWMADLLADERRPAAGGTSASWLDRPGDAGRREVLRQALGLAVVGGLGSGALGWYLDQVRVGDEPTGQDQPLNAIRDEIRLAAETEGRAVSFALPNPLPQLGGDFPAPEGVRPRVTDNDRFYTVDIETRDPNLPELEWRLRVHGAVETEFEITYEELLSLPAIELDGTLRCISYEFDNGLISTTRWTGTPMRNLIERAGPLGSAVDIVLRGAGGYADSIPLAKALEPTTLLAYAMNGETLARHHGFPCRAFVPNLYGIKNVKWLQEIVVLERDFHGFWQERGWTETGVVNVISIIDTPLDTVAMDSEGRVPVGGITFAGARGIASVQVSIDEGDWQDADVEPYEPTLIWQRWRFDWQAEPGRRQLRVRATDRAGVAQTTEPAEPHPDGVGGVHTVEVTVF